MWPQLECKGLNKHGFEQARTKEFVTWQTKGQKEYAK